MSGSTTKKTTKRELCLQCGKELSPVWAQRQELTGETSAPAVCAMAGCLGRTFQFTGELYRCVNCDRLHLPVQVTRTRRRLVKHAPKFFCNTTCAARYGRKAARAGVRL